MNALFNFLKVMDFCILTVYEPFIKNTLYSSRQGLGIIYWRNQSLKTSMQFIALGLLLSVIVLNAAHNSVVAQESNGTPSQVVDPFVEMKPGVYVAWDWWNDTGNYEYNGNDDPYEYEPYYYEVYDINGNVYYIEDNFTYSYVDNWNFTSLLVTIILDPDASVMAALAEQNESIDIWNLFWMPDTQYFTGDEVFLYSLFYFSSYYSYMYYSSDFVWYNENMTEVDPNDVIPYLAQGYEWASYMNESIEYEYEWDYGGYGYDVNEMFLSGNQSLWMEHYFLGLTAFNDTNNNGIMDVSYTEVPINYENDSNYSDWVYYELNNSEYVYDFIPTSGTIGEIETPHLNDNGEIQWGAEVTNIEGELWPELPILYFDNLYEMDYGFGNDNGFSFDSPEPIAVNLDSFSMTYKFDVVDEAAVLKIDQYIGDFSDPETGGQVEEIQGLSLALNYWSSFSSYSITAEAYDEDLDPTGTYDEPGELPEIPSNLTYVEDIPDGTLQFIDEDAIRTMVDFGGTYVWGKNGATYNVSTAVMPSLFYSETANEMTPAGTMDALESYTWQVYYYSSCYSNWSGYSITHDPIFSVFPNQSPSQVSQFIDSVLIASIGVGGVGVLALVLVGIRTVSLRKSS